MERTAGAPAGWGTTRRQSVVNKFHRAHEVPNLFIVDGSSLVTGGRNHPTMTISALAYRAADYLVRAAKRGDLTRPRNLSLGASRFSGDSNVLESPDRVFLATTHRLDRGT